MCEGAPACRLFSTSSRTLCQRAFVNYVTRLCDGAVGLETRRGLDGHCQRDCRHTSRENLPNSTPKFQCVRERPYMSLIFDLLVHIVSTGVRKLRSTPIVWWLDVVDQGFVLQAPEHYEGRCVLQCSCVWMEEEGKSTIARECACFVLLNLRTLRNTRSSHNAQ